MSLKIVLIEPEIPQNTGNIGRLAVALGAELFLVGNLGFSLEEKQIRRSGMDYWKDLKLTRIHSIEDYLPLINENTSFISTKGKKPYTNMPENTDMIVFGNESSGLPNVIYEKYSDQLFRMPMKEGIRSINLAASVAAVAYYIAARTGFEGLL